MRAMTKPVMLLLLGQLMTGLCASAAVEPLGPLQAEPFPLSAVRLLEGPFQDAMRRDQDYLLSLEPDPLLHMFRVTAGLPAPGAPYGGWEAAKCELRGHSLGHYLSACALMYASTGDERLRRRGDLLVGELAKCQAALPKQGYHDGFLSAYPEEFFDRVDARKPVWAPYYTLHKIMAGLLDVHQLCGNAQALDILVRMATWLDFRVGRLSTEQMQKSLDAEHGGMNEVFANLYAVTANPVHLRLAQAFNHRFVFDPMAHGEDKLDGLHANTQIPKIIGAAREFELTGQSQYQDIARFFWDRVALHRSYVIGGHSDREHFFPITDFASHLGTETCETCNTYNMLKLTRHLFAWRPEARTMDFYERALFNHILASQDPRTGMFVYFPALKPGHFKPYSTPTNSFWCCVGTGMENHAKYGDTIFYRSPGALWVNLFIAAEVRWPETGLVVRQETRFPEADTTRLVFQCAKATRLALRLRHPAWTPSMSVKVNGKTQRLSSRPGSYATLERKWKNGDTVEVQLPMALRAEALPGDPSHVAFLFGPIVLAGELGSDNLPNLYLVKQTDLSRSPAPEVPVLVAENAASALTHIRSTPSGPLAFRTEGLGRPGDVSLIPFYKLHHQRYSVYWRLLSEASWQQQRTQLAELAIKRQADAARIVDEVQPGEQQPETDHRWSSDQSRTGEAYGRKWRDAAPGGWFSYDFKTLPDQPMTLVCTYWGGDSGAREFDILLDGQPVARQKLAANRPGEFFDVSYRLPEQLTRGKARITIKFQALPGQLAGGVFAVRVLKQASSVP